MNALVVQSYTMFRAVELLGEIKRQPENPTFAIAIKWAIGHQREYFCGTSGD